MALAVIADIHGNLSALDAVLSDIARRGVSRIVNLGDCLSGPLDARGTSERLMALDLLTVRGNHDRQLIDRPADRMGLWETWCIGDLDEAHLDWLRALPPVLEVEGALLCHGTPESDETNWLDERVGSGLVLRPAEEIAVKVAGLPQTLFLSAHTHVPRIVRLSDGRLCVNPGSVGCPAYADTRLDPPFRMETGAPDARYAIVERQDHTWSAALIAVPYDTTPMVRLAEKRGADDWVYALTTGRIPL